MNPPQMVGETTRFYSPGADHRVSHYASGCRGEGYLPPCWMANLQATLRGQTLFDATPASAIRRSNKLLWEVPARRKFATVFFGFSTREPSLQYVNAGRRSVHPDGRSPETGAPGGGGGALGPGRGIDFKEGTVTLRPRRHDGDRLRRITNR